jgi:hypothetical protein
MPARRSGLRRFVERVRHGLLTQEILEQVARKGLVVYPYLVAIEPAPREAVVAADALCSARMLSGADAAEIIGISSDAMAQPPITALQSPGACYGVFYDGNLAGYTWASTEALTVPWSGGQALFKLQPHEAYLFSIYVARPYRGLRIAGYLRQSMQQELMREGRTLFYSLSAVFNRATRRFKSRLGAREVELRLYVHLRLRSLPGFDLRLWRRPPHLRSPRLKRVAAVVGARFRD